ncbi:MAG: hypothetical protein EA398_17175 [Deltaproteobacteria bacterium]|nr:MAG: hypothetical protein EA398_17175 [Deltaproteobacteria bacterium]
MRPCPSLPALPFSGAVSAAGVVLVFGLLGGALPAAAESGPRWSARSTVHVDLHAFRTADGERAERRRFTQDITLHATRPEGPPLRGTVRSAFTFDAGLPGDVQDPLLGERQLEPTLHEAHVQWRPFSPVGVTAGRHLLASPLGLARIDGASLLLHPGEGVLLALAAGLRPDLARWQLDDWSHHPDGDPEGRRALGGAGALLEARAGWVEERFALDVGGRIEPAADGRTRYADGLHLGARFGSERRAHARASVRYTPLLDLVDRAEVRGQIPLGADAGVHAGGLLARPVFPLDSIFSVFPLSARSELALGGHARPFDRVRLDGSVLATAQAEEETATPIVLRDATDLGVHAGVHVRSTRRAGTWGVQGRLTGRSDRHRATALARSTWRVGPRGPDLHATISLLQWHEPRRARERDRVGGAGWGGTGATFHLGGGSSVLTRMDAGLDHRGDLGLRAIALLDLRLPGIAP